MKKIDWRFAFETVAVISIVLSLLFVGMELRQSTRVSRFQALQDFTTFMGGLNADSSRDVEMSTKLMKAFLDRDTSQFAVSDRAQLSLYMNAALNAHQTLFQAVQEGIVPESFLRITEGAAIIRSDYFEELWPSQRSIMTEEFARYIDELYENKE